MRDVNDEENDRMGQCLLGFCGGGDYVGRRESSVMAVEEMCRC